MNTAVAAIVNLARRHGLTLTPDDLHRLVGALPDGDLFLLLHTARQVGFNVVPLEGDYEHLPEVPLPAIVVLRGDAPAVTFAVLTHLDAEGATVLGVSDPLPQRLARDAFVQRWTGDVVQALPEDASLAATRARLAARRDPWVQLRLRLGLADDPGAGRYFVPLALVAAAVTEATLARVTAGPLRVVAVLVAIALVGSLWSALLLDRCQSCSRTAALVGELPVAWLGVAAYLAVLAGLALGAPAGAFVAVALCTALGVHLGLLGVLVRSSVRCAPCVTVATAVLAATVVATLAGAVVPWAFTATLVGAVVTPALAGWATTRHEARIAAGSQRLAQALADEVGAVAAGHVVMVVVTRAGCPQCSFFDAALRPAIEASYGERVTIETRPPGDAPARTPLVVACGATVRLALAGLPDEGAYERVSGMVDAALAAEGVRHTVPAGCLVLRGHDGT